MYSPFEIIRVGIGPWNDSHSAGATSSSCSSLNHESSSREPGYLLSEAILVSLRKARCGLHLAPARHVTGSAIGVSFEFCARFCKFAHRARSAHALFQARTKR